MQKISRPGIQMKTYTEQLTNQYIGPFPGPTQNELYLLIINIINNNKINK